MSQEINLYQPIKKQRELSFGGVNVLMGIFLVVIGLAIYSGVMLSKFYYFKAQVAEVEAQKSAILANRNEITLQLAKYADMDVNEEIRKIEHLLANRKQIYDKLQADMFSTGNGYSGYFVAFARQHISGLWLTDISLARAGRDLILRGQSTDAYLLPRYLEKLSGEKLLAGTNLSDFQLYRPTEDEQGDSRADYIDFMISTAPPEDVL